MGINPPVKQLSILTGSVLLALSANIQASGFAIIEHSASGMGNAFAGGGAIAEDASTVYFNPAGMTNLTGSQLVAAGHIIAPTAEYNDRGSYVNPMLTGGTPIPDSLTGRSNDDGGEAALVPNMYFSSQLSDNLFAGIGINAPFGLATEYDDEWVGRYHALRSELRTININPAIAFKVNDMFSIGGGINVQYADATLSKAIDFGTVCGGMEQEGYLPEGTCGGAGVLPLQADGEAEVTGSDWSFGYNLGALINITEGTRIGLAYRSKIEQSLEGDAEFTVPANFQAILDMGLPLFSDTGAAASVDLPETVSISIFSQITPAFALMADATFTKWSRFEELRITFDNPNQPDTVEPENWDDTMRYSIGASYKPNDKMIFRIGGAYDETPITRTEDRSPRIPGNDRTWFTLGFGYQLSERMGMDVGYAHLFIDDTDINRLNGYNVGHQLVGEYTADVDIISAQLNVKF